MVLHSNINRGLVGRSSFASLGSQERCRGVARLSFYSQHRPLIPQRQSNPGLLMPPRCPGIPGNTPCGSKTGAINARLCISTASPGPSSAPQLPLCTLNQKCAYKFAPSGRPKDEAQALGGQTWGVGLPPDEERGGPQKLPPCRALQEASCSAERRREERL